MRHVTPRPQADTSTPPPGAERAAATDHPAPGVGSAIQFRLQLTNRDTGQQAVAGIRSPFAVVGRWAECGLRLKHPSVSKRHSLLWAAGSRLYFFDLGSRRGLLLNGTQCLRGWLKRGDTLQIGDIDVRLGDSAEAAPVRGDTCPTEGVGPFELFRSDGVTPDTTRHSLAIPLTVIGRDARSDIRLDDPRVGRFHAAVACASGEAWLIDLFTQTRLNGRLVRHAALYAGDRIDMNGVTVVSAIPRQEEPVPPTSDDALAEFHSIDDLIAPKPGYLLSAEGADVRDQLRMIASLFTTMQNEQMDLMRQQTEVLREISAAIREGRLAPPTAEVLQALTAPPPPTVEMPKPRPPQPGDAEAFAKAHEWLMSRFGVLGPREGEK